MWFNCDICSAFHDDGAFLVIDQKGKEKKIKHICLNCDEKIQKLQEDIVKYIQEPSGENETKYNAALEEYGKMLEMTPEEVCDYMGLNEVQR